MGIWGETVAWEAVYQEIFVFEYRMPSHRCFITIILGKIRGNPGIYKLEYMLFDGFETFGDDVISIFLG